MQETWVQSLGQKDPLEKGMTTPSSTVAWKIPWIEDYMGYSPWGDKELDTTERLTLSFRFHFPLILKIKHLMPTFAILCFAPRLLSFPVILLYFFSAPPPSFPLKVLHASIDHPLSLHPYLFLFSLLLWTWSVVFFH